MEWWSIAKYQIGPSDTPPCGRVPGFQAPNLRVSGVGCQEKETWKLKPPSVLEPWQGRIG